MRHNISYNAVSRVLLTMLGSGPGRAFVEVNNDVVRAQLGWSGNVTIPRNSIATVEQIDRIPRWMGWGVHGNLFGLVKAWAFNGASIGAVKLTLREPAKARVLGVPIRATIVYFSIEDPEGFVSEVRSSVRP